MQWQSPNKMVPRNTPPILWTKPKNISRKRRTTTTENKAGHRSAPSLGRPHRRLKTLVCLRLIRNSRNGQPRHARRWKIEYRAPNRKPSPPPSRHNWRNSKLSRKLNNGLKSNRNEKRHNAHKVKLSKRASRPSSKRKKRKTPDCRRSSKPNRPNKTGKLLSNSSNSCSNRRTNLGSRHNRPNRPERSFSSKPNSNVPACSIS